MARLGANRLYDDQRSFSPDSALRTRGTPYCARGIVQKTQCPPRLEPHSMPRIVEEVYYDGAKERIERLGITPLIDEIKSIIASFALLVEEAVDANGGAAVRKCLTSSSEKVAAGRKGPPETLTGRNASV
jgi:hypothetical protein